MALGTGIIVAVAVILFLAIVVGYFVSIFNGLVRLKNNIKKSWSNIDVLLKQRHDELPKLIASVKGYMAHEQGTLRKVTEARTAFMSANTVAEKAKADNML
ncbi:MAG: LemA family protein, partial [Nanoarchaeota archaeon]|nr:LemA family protein [Nanoarchaeota archaeon]